jgi:hypothetical protein
MKRFVWLFSAIALFATLLCAADVNGKWSGAFDLNGNKLPLTFDLKADGDTVTGNIVGLSPTGPTTIKDGKIKDDSVTFTAVTEYQGNPVNLVYTGKVSGDEIAFTMGTADGSWSVNFAAKKTKAE